MSRLDTKVIDGEVNVTIGASVALLVILTLRPSKKIPYPDVGTIYIIYFPRWFVTTRIQQYLVPLGITETVYKT
jgi:hypothetical protein